MVAKPSIHSDSSQQPFTHFRHRGGEGPLGVVTTWNCPASFKTIARYIAGTEIACHPQILASGLMNAFGDNKRYESNTPTSENAASCFSKVGGSLVLSTLCSNTPIAGRRNTGPASAKSAGSARNPATTQQHRIHHEKSPDEYDNTGANESDVRSNTKHQSKMRPLSQTTVNTSATTNSNTANAA
jgi:hypothetical protein